ncbi:synembryn-A-like [Pollicipes pollicipes]|uniref:synembryn-A-like n=1 Tax=Pollicipes pollicipes TaxID=41117 RepID=UPI0018857B74|nr:synembryn-A-like [Pollicipes pollicipes]
MTEVLDLLLSTCIAAPAGPADVRARGVELASEVLKTVYALSVSLASPDEEDEGHLMRLTEVLREYLVLPHSPADLLNYVVQVLTTVPSSCYTALVVPETAGARADAEGDTAALDAVLGILTDKIQQPQSAVSQREQLTPVLLLLCHSSKACRTIRRYFRVKVTAPPAGSRPTTRSERGPQRLAVGSLPPRRDVMLRPEQGNSLKSQLVKLMTSAGVRGQGPWPLTSLFILCKEDVGRFVKYTGYGNAAGLLAARGPHAGADRAAPATPPTPTSDTDEYVQYRDSLGLIQPCRIGEDGKPHPISHVLELQDQADPAAGSDDE